MIYWGIAQRYITCAARQVYTHGFDHRGLSRAWLYDAEDKSDFIPTGKYQVYLN